MERFDIEQVIRILGLSIHSEQADGGRDFDVACRIAENALRKYKNYRDLEEQGLLLKLPCKVGDTLYRVYKRPTKCSVHGQYRDDYSCCGCEEEECDSYYEWSIYEYKTTIKDIVCLMDEIGKTVFLTQSEAEEVLEKMEREE